MLLYYICILYLISRIKTWTSTLFAGISVINFIVDCKKKRKSQTDREGGGGGVDCQRPTTFPLQVRKEREREQKLLLRQEKEKKREDRLANKSGSKKKSSRLMFKDHSS